ncbi:uncharacterized protein LOC128875168 [Hylaeus volcanicus]|uniref:uncharacterized protein LOC128875168 n=1 Tax=Hylaeus volcanicus TaxID=313075 RepID=UPI0023B7D01C|nr:uncharacterized protein LOC128875168 [Hylaeus volcanicus]XP_053976528.1 uncharacterized protein LOC128875168 [Hylaeus volcanicus]
MSSSRTGGVRPISIAGRVGRERERLIGMTDEERAWRARYLKSQILAPEEPIVPEGYYKEAYNPIRRFYRAPLNAVEKALSGLVGPTPAFVIRGVTGRLLMGIAGIYCAWYYFKYNTAQWTRVSGWRIIKPRPTLFVGDKDFPNYEVKTPQQYATRGFENSPI